MIVALGEAEVGKEADVLGLSGNYVEMKRRCFDGEREDVHASGYG